MLMISHAEKQQEAALDRLSSYELKPQSVLYDDPDVKQITARSPYMRDERWAGQRFSALLQRPW
jgi:hypothetical protein